MTAARIAPVLLALLAATAQAEDDFAARVAPFLERYCLRCHGGEEPKGELSLERFTSTASVAAKPRLWRKIARILRQREMPPEEEAQPSAAEVSALRDWIESALATAAENQPAGRVTVRRLNRAEYNNTVRDLLGVSLRPADAFPNDDTGYGFDTVGDVLSMPPILLEKYMNAAERVAERAVLVYRPTAKRFEAESMLKEGKGGNRSGWARFSNNGSVAIQVRVHHAGSYRLRARAYGQQAGPEAVRLAFRIDGRQVGATWVKAEEDAPQVYTGRAKLSPGVHTFSVAFVNDYYKKDHPDPRQRDRNMAVDWCELEGPTEPPALPAFHARIAQEDPAIAIRDLADRAFRRPATAEEVTRLLALHDAVRADGDTPERALQLVVQAVLVSPQFLFRFEAPPRGEATSRELDEFELATRLSYFLWSSLPDEALFEHARNGTLRANLRAEVERLLDHPRSGALVTNFAGQWLELRRLAELTPDPKSFPTFDDELRAAMVEETERVFEAILREKRSVLDFLGGDFTFVNERLARHYGIEGIKGPRFRRVELPPGRAGILTHASVLTVTSNPTRTSLVKRGKWVLEQILDSPTKDPPPGVANLANTPPAQRKLSLREELEQHRADPTCASCHVKLDPLGFGLEHFDGVGAWRDRDGRFPVDASGEFPDGTRFTGAIELRDALLANRAEDLVLCLARKLLTYGIGRGLRDADEPAITKLVRSLAPDYRLDDLIVGLVRLDAFNRQGK